MVSLVRSTAMYPCSCTCQSYSRLRSYAQGAKSARKPVMGGSQELCLMGFWSRKECTQHAQLGGVLPERRQHVAALRRHAEQAAEQEDPVDPWRIRDSIRARSI